jgi:putative flippase GtrA
MIRQAAASGLFTRGRRYLTVGALCALTHNLILIGSDFAGIHYFPATLLSCAIVTPLGYFLHCRFTFRQDSSLSGFLRFSAGIAAAFPLSLGLMVLFCSVFDWPVLVAAPLTTILLIAYNYVSAHWAILRRWRPTTN